MHERGGMLKGYTTPCSRCYVHYGRKHKCRLCGNFFCQERLSCGSVFSDFNSPLPVCSRCAKTDSERSILSPASPNDVLLVHDKKYSRRLGEGSFGVAECVIGLRTENDKVIPYVVKTRKTQNTPGLEWNPLREVHLWNKFYTKVYRGLFSHFACAFVNENNQLVTPFIKDNTRGVPDIRKHQTWDALEEEILTHLDRVMIDFHVAGNIQYVVYQSNLYALPIDFDAMVDLTEKKYTDDQGLAQYYRDQEFFYIPRSPRSVVLSSQRGTINEKDYSLEALPENFFSLRKSPTQAVPYPSLEETYEYRGVKYWKLRQK